VREPPPQHVLDAFGVGDPQPLPGGTGRSWAAGPLVLKPLDLSLDGLAWQARVLSELDEEGFRVAPPEPRVVDGWTAWRRLDGAHEPGRWLDAIAAGERFHAALADVPRPAFLDERADPWSIGDRAAWDDDALAPWLAEPTVARLAELRTPVDGPSSVVHGDLTGNVLYADGLPPAIIDFSPYWRPPAWASAVVVADALVWEGAPDELAQRVDRGLLVRAAIYRAVTELAARGSVTSDYDRVARLCA
jgi:uncharacterized protein (TIGR02569 family)